MPEVGASKFPLNWSMASSRAGYQLQDAGHWWVLVMVLLKKNRPSEFDGKMWDNFGLCWIAGFEHLLLAILNR